MNRVQLPFWKFDATKFLDPGHMTFCRLSILENPFDRFWD